MKLSKLYSQVLKFGAERDPRGKKSKISSYEDTAILFGDPDTEVKKILVGIDIEVPELLLADRIRQQEGLDLVLSHHPEGKAYASLHKVMQLQVAMLKGLGMAQGVAQKFLDERMREVERRVMPQNHTRPVDAARLLNMPFMCAHTPADNHVQKFITDLMRKRKPRRVADIVDILMEVPEYAQAEKNSAGPRIISGNPAKYAGLISVEMTGGTEGSAEIFGKLYKKGVRTLICMHLGEEHFKKVKDANLNVVIAGHISSDNLGLNLLLDNIEKEQKERLQIISCSGFTRVRRQ
ncbi:MAG: NGG1p interacting factor NIF3 [Candidatus Omnitrophica bacterium]|nr:NGG1p interacting factor NIF3 [Candidatus Omnitrophota bacterium]